METLYSGIRTKFHGKCASDKFFLKIGFMHLLELRPNQNNLIQGRTGHFSLSSLSLAKGSQLPIVTCILTAIIDLLTLTYKPDLDWQGEPPRRIYRSRVISFQSNRTTHTHTHTQVDRATRTTKVVSKAIVSLLRVQWAVGGDSRVLCCTGQQ